jgi:hypothetical protein
MLVVSNISIVLAASKVESGYRVSETHFSPFQFRSIERLRLLVSLLQHRQMLHQSLLAALALLADRCQRALRLRMGVHLLRRPLQ